MSYFESISVNYQKDGTSDVFGRLKVGNSKTLFDSKLIYDKRDLFFTESLINGGTSTFISNNASVDLQTTTANGSTAIRQTKEYFNYQSGKAIFTSISFILGTKKTNVTKRVGLFDSNNGFFLKQDGVNLSLVRRTFTSGSVVDNEVLQSSWNLDKLDGTGKSGLTFDETKIQLMSIEFTWQGAGQCRIGFYLEDKFILVHQFLFSNVLTTVHISTPSLPVRFEITNTGTTASPTSLRSICISVNSEGGYDPKGIGYSVINSTTISVGNNTNVPLLAIRLKSNFNRIPTIIKNIGIVTPGNNPMKYFCYFDSTITGGTWVSAGTYSAIEYNETITSFSGGELVKSGFVSAQSRQQDALIDSTFKLVSNFTGVSGTFVIVGRGIGNTSALVSIDWIEEW